MQELTAIEAAQRLGKNEKTIRRWIQTGRLPARKIVENRYAIDLRDVEALLPAVTSTRPDDYTALLARMAAMEQSIQELRREIESMRLLPGPDSLAIGPAEKAEIYTRLDKVEAAQREDKKGQKRTDETEINPEAEKGRKRQITEAEGIQSPPLQDATKYHLVREVRTVRNDDLSVPDPEAIPLHLFAKLHGVKRETLKTQFETGKVRASVRPLPNRPGQTEKYFTLEEQKAVIAFWQRNGTDFSSCPYCPHEDNAL